MESEMKFMNSFVHKAAGKDDHHSHYHKKALNWLLPIGFWLLRIVLVCMCCCPVSLYSIAKAILNRGTRKRREELVRKTLEWLDREERPDLSLTLTLQKKNTALHIAVTFQQVELAEKIIELCPPLVSQPNSKGDTPLHIAAKAGHRELTELLLNAVMKPVTDPKNLEEGTSGNSLGEKLKMKNLEGNTPFHEALRKGQAEVALYLLNLCEELACVVNDAGESPLYLSAEAGLVNVVSKLIQGPDCSIQGPDGQTPLHIAAIKGRSEIVRSLRKCGSIDAKQVDFLGKTALHYAAYVGNHEILSELISAIPSPVYISDNDGNSPLHIIAMQGHEIRMVEAIMVTNPCVAEFVDRKGQNALHLAAMKGHKRMLQCMLEWPELRVLVNEGDGDGNTPLHLAVKNHEYGAVKSLLKMGADPGVTNKEGLTPLDISEFYKGFSVRQISIRGKLMYYGAGKGRLAWVERVMQGFRDSVDYRSEANTLSVVAALLATITFAAAFTVPGGYDGDGPDEGFPIFIRSAALKVFVVSDFIAFCSSLIVAFLLIWAMKGDPALLGVAFPLTLQLSFVAGSATVVALVTALYVVLSHQSLWLAIALICTGCSVPPVVTLLLLYSGKTTPIQWKLRFRDKIQSAKWRTLVCSFHCC